ncbi:protein of unknown function [Pseudomonas mediterranea]
MHLFGSLLPQPPANHIHHITPIAQRYRQHFTKVREHHRIRADIGTKRNILQHLGHATNTVVGSFEEDIERCFGVDEKGSGDAVDASDRHVSIHFEDLCLIG